MAGVSRLSVVPKQELLSVEIGNDMIERNGGCAVTALMNTPKIHCADIILAELKAASEQGICAHQMTKKINQLAAAYEAKFE